MLISMMKFGQESWDLWDLKFLPTGLIFKLSGECRNKNHDNITCNVLGCNDLIK